MKNWQGEEWVVLHESYLFQAALVINGGSKIERELATWLKQAACSFLLPFFLVQEKRQADL